MFARYVMLHSLNNAKTSSARTATTGCTTVTRRRRARLPPLQTQIGGDHYKSMPIQPLEYIHKNGLDYMQGNVIKYITRHKSKNGRQDVEKALHYCQLILELQYGDES